jgi:general secretion pathway protein M
MMAAWWNRLQPRERNMLAIGAIVCAISLAWAFVWHPLSRARTDAHTRVERARDDVAWMRSMTAQANELHTQGARGHAERQGKSLLALADASARAAGLSGALKRVEPTGGNGVRVSFEVANFDMLVEWLSQLARDYGVRVSDFSADKIEGLGLVNARVTLEESQR